MLKFVKSVMAPIWSISLLMLGTAFFISFLSMRLKLTGEPPAVVGVVQSAYYFGIWIGALWVEKLIRRIGHIRAFAAFVGSTVSTVMFQGLYQDPIFWVFMRFLAGASLAGLYVVIESWLLHKSSLKNRGQILAIYMISVYSSQAVSQFILDVIDVGSPEPFLVAGLLCSLSVIPIATTRATSPELHEPTLPNVFQLFKLSPFGCSGCVLAGFILSAIYSFTPNYALETNISVAATVSTTILGGVFLQWPIGKISDLFERRHVLLFTSIATIFPSIGILYASGNEPLILTIVFILGGLCFTLYPLSISQVCDYIEAHNITAVTGVLLLAYGMGSALGPLAASWIISYLGPEGLYVYIAILAAFLAVIGILREFFGTHIPKEEQEEFVALPRTGHVALDLDPRAEEEATHS